MIESITVNMVKGGFILNYPTSNGGQTTEVFVSPRKLQQKIKELIEALSYVSEEK